MTNINVIFQPFIRSQKVEVYEDNLFVKQVFPYLENLVDTLEELSLEYKANKINLCGNKDFASKYAKKIQTKFNNIEVNIISR